MTEKQSEIKKIKIYEIEYSLIVPEWTDYMNLFAKKEFSELQSKGNKESQEIGTERMKFIFKEWISPIIPEEYYSSRDPKLIGFLIVLQEMYFKPFQEMMELKKKLGLPLE